MAADIMVIAVLGVLAVNGFVLALAIAYSVRHPEMRRPSR
jgi:hypothetical protein